MRAASGREGGLRALVFFGATGNLARQQIFSALYAMTKRGVLNVPVVGVAHSGLECRAAAQPRKGQHRPQCWWHRRPARGSVTCCPGLGTWTGIQGFRHVAALKEALAKPPSRALPGHPTASLATVIKELGAAGLADTRGHHREGPSGRPRVARRLNALLRPSSGDSIFRIDHFLARTRSRTCSYFRFSNSFLEPI